MESSWSKFFEKLSNAAPIIYEGIKQCAEESKPDSELQTKTKEIKTIWDDIKKNPNFPQWKKEHEGEFSADALLIAALEYFDGDKNED